MVKELAIDADYTLGVGAVEERLVISNGATVTGVMPFDIYSERILESPYYREKPTIENATFLVNGVRFEGPGTFSNFYATMPPFQDLVDQGDNPIYSKGICQMRSGGVTLNNGFIDSPDQRDPPYIQWNVFLFYTSSSSDPVRINGCMLNNGASALITGWMSGVDIPTTYVRNSTLSNTSEYGCIIVTDNTKMDMGYVEGDIVPEGAIGDNVISGTTTIKNVSGGEIKADGNFYALAGETATTEVVGMGAPPINGRIKRATLGEIVYFNGVQGAYSTVIDNGNPSHNPSKLNYTRITRVQQWPSQNNPVEDSEILPLPVYEGAPVGGLASIVAGAAIAGLGARAIRNNKEYRREFLSGGRK